MGTTLKKWFESIEWAQWALALAICAAMVLLPMAQAFAQTTTGTTGTATAGISTLCVVKTWVMNMAKVAAVIALVLLVLNSFFGKNSVVGEIIQYVLIGCVIIVGADALILSGLFGSASLCTASA